MNDDVILNKAESIERCVVQARRYFASGDAASFSDDFLRQDAVALNIQRGCEQAIDLANHLIRKKALGLPKSSRDSFTLLAEAGLLEAGLSGRLQRMIGFRNILVHQYRQLDVGILVRVVENDLDDLLEMTRIILQLPEES